MKRLYFCPILHMSETFALDDTAMAAVVGDFFQTILQLFDKGLLQKLTIYVPGRVLHLAGTKHKTLVNALKRKVDEGHIEFLAGGYYDPIFPIIPAKSQELQIKLHLQELDKWFGVQPEGFWLPSFVWESSLIQPLGQFGINYTVLKDYQLEGALWRYPTTKGYWALEDQGHLLKCISTPSKFFQNFRENKLEEIKAEMSSVTEGAHWFSLDISFLRHQRGVYESHWFENLENLLLLLSDLEVTQKTLSRQIHEQECGGNVNLPTTVGRSLGLEVGLSSVRDLLILQPEANWIHKQMLDLHRKIQGIESERLRHILEVELLQTQSSYWYRNQFATGGLMHLQDRLNVSQKLNLIEDQWQKHLVQNGVWLDEFDLLARGSTQLHLGNPHFSLLIEHREGGRIRTWNLFNPAQNIVNGYNPPTKKQLQRPYFSVMPACGSIDHFFAPNQFLQAAHIEDADLSDTIMAHPMDYSLRTTADAMQVTLVGALSKNIENVPQMMRTEKVFSVSAKKNELTQVMQITNSTFQKLEGIWASEWNLTLGDLDFSHSRVRINHQKLENCLISGTFEEVELLEIIDPISKIRMQWQFLKPCKMMFLPLWQKLGKTGEPTFQGLRLIFGWELSLLGQEKFSTTLRAKVKKLWGWR